jgi:hypothetical protein
MRFWRPAECVDWGPHEPSVPLRVLLAIALLGGVATAAYRYTEVWTPLQRGYFFAYVWSEVAVTARGDYDLWQVIDQKGSRLALDEELVSVTSVAGDTSFALSDTAVKVGATRLVWQRHTYDHTALHAFLREWIYRGQSLLDLVIPAIWGTLALFLGGVMGARAQAVVDARRWRAGSSTWNPPGLPRPVIIDHVDSQRRPPASSLVVANRPSPEGLVPSPASPPRLTSGAAAGPAPPVRVSPPAPSAAWPDPFFR